MPELPEVEVTRRGLAPQLSGRRISGVSVREPRLRWPVPSEVLSLAGRTVGSIRRRGKYLLVDCGDGHLILHLGMSGSLRVLPPETPAGKHDHFDLLLGDRMLRLRDPRRFGAVLWAAGDIATHPLLAHLGVEPLSRALTPARLHALTRGHRTAIKHFLMDGRRVVGVGNIYASESLFRARINPRMSARKLSLVASNEASHGYQAHAERGDPGGRLDLARFRRRRRRRGLRTAAPLRVRPRREELPPLRDADPQAGAGTALDLLLPYLPEVALAFRRFSTEGWTNSETSPPSAAISRTSVAEMNMCCSEGVRNMVSISG